MKTCWILLSVLLTFSFAGCGHSSDLLSGDPQVPPENPLSNSTKPVEVPPLSTSLPDSPSQGDATPMLDLSETDIQKLIQTATEDLAKRFSVASDQIQFKEATEVVWPDSSLGCPNPASSYLQVVTPGYLIRLRTLERVFEYHTDKKGLVRYCENPSVLPLDSLPSE